MKSYLIVLLAWNIIVMFIYGIDKMQAKREKRRISEKALLLCAFLLGGYGAVFGMILFNHKTSKIKFRILVPIAMAITITAIYFVKT